MRVRGYRIAERVRAVMVRQLRKMRSAGFRGDAEAQYALGAMHSHEPASPSPMRRAGACIVGQVRTFFAPCVGVAMRTDILIPLNLRTHVVMHGNVTDDGVRRVLAGVDVANVMIQPWSRPHKRNCTASGNGMHIAHGLIRCFRSIVSDAGVEYTWIVRLRSDHAPSFRITALPNADAYYNRYPHAKGIALVNLLNHCTCGWHVSCTAFRTTVRCSWAGDQFAFLHGTAIVAYLRDMDQYMCDHQRMKIHRHVLHRIAPEMRVGRLLSAANVTMHDVRFISLFFPPRLQRSSNCKQTPGASARAATPAKSTSSVFPPGPWDQRRSTVCRAQRELPLKRRYWCLPHEGQYDDERTVGDVQRVLKARPSGLTHTFGVI